MRIVFASHTHLGGAFVVGSHHLAREMSLAGHRVAHISTPITPFHAAFSRDPEVYRRYRQWARPFVDATGVLNVVPLALIPWPVTAHVKPLWLRFGMTSYPRVRRLVARHLGGRPDVLLIDQPKLVGLTRTLEPATVIYRPTDLYGRLPGNAAIDGAEALAIARATAVVATSEAVAEHVRGIDPAKPTFVLPNGVELRHFTRPMDRPPEYSEPRVRAVYVGALDDRFDLVAVRRLAAAEPTVELVLIGPSNPTVDAVAREHANVRVLGSRPYSAVPAYLQHADVGLLPLSDHPANLGRSPMKLYEYGAAGLPVLVRYTPEIAARRASFVFTYRDHPEMIALFRRLIAPDGGVTVPAAEVSEHSWEGIAARLLELAR